MAADSSASGVDIVLWESEPSETGTSAAAGAAPIESRGVLGPIREDVLPEVGVYSSIRDDEPVTDNTDNWLFNERPLP